MKKNIIIFLGAVSLFCENITFVSKSITHNIEMFDFNVNKFPFSYSKPCSQQRIKSYNIVNKKDTEVVENIKYADCVDTFFIDKKDDFYIISFDLHYVYAHQKYKNLIQKPMFYDISENEFKAKKGYNFIEDSAYTMGEIKYKTGFIIK